MRQPTIEDRLKSLEEDFANLRSSVCLLLDQFQPLQPPIPERTTPRTRSRQHENASTGPDWAFSISAAFERLSREIADLKMIATATTSVPDEIRPFLSIDSMTERGGHFSRHHRKTSRPQKLIYQECGRSTRHGSKL
jgi:hypothetical protein